MNLYEAVRNRRSIRSYEEEKISEELLHGLKMYAERITPLCNGIKTEFVFITAGEKGVKIKGLFRVLAPHYLVLYSEEKEGWMENAGYVMEQMALYMTARGLGSCYMGAAKAIGSQREGMKQAAILAFGYGRKQAYRDQGPAKRLDEKELCIYPGGNDISPELAAVIHAARLAPSSFNSQPWRFVVCYDRIHLFARRSRLAAGGFGALEGVNMGIVLSHIMLAAEEQWMTAELIREEELIAKEYKNGTYFCTVVFS